MWYQRVLLVPMKTKKLVACTSGIFALLHKLSVTWWLVSGGRSYNLFLSLKPEFVFCFPLVNIIQHWLDNYFSFTHRIYIEQNLKIINKNGSTCVVRDHCTSELTFIANRVTLSIDPWGTRDSCLFSSDSTLDNLLFQEQSNHFRHSSI